MQVFKDLITLKSYLAALRSGNKSIGFVPTMGALHQGHVALVGSASVDNDCSLVSIFVNPTQFNNAQDLSSYPRNSENDIKILRDSGNCDAVYLPGVPDLYPNGPQTEDIELGNLDLVMEGKFRPGHFQGVATVVKRFFEIIEPSKAYFGEKDWQQLAVIRKMTSYFNLPVSIIGHPTERNSEGLALSSRNQLLSPEERTAALVIIQSLKWSANHYQDYTPKSLAKEIENRFAASSLELEYVSFSDPDKLLPIKNWHDVTHARCFIAAHISGVRLIDNLSLF